MLKMQAHNHIFRLNVATDKKVHPEKNELESSTFFWKLLKNRNPLELRDQGGHSETSKHVWIRLLASIS